MDCKDFDFRESKQKLNSFEIIIPWELTPATTHEKSYTTIFSNDPDNNEEMGDEKKT